MSCGLYAVGRHFGRFPALPARKTTLSGPVCSTGSMDSDSRMGQGLGQNPGKPEGHFPSGMGFWEGRWRAKFAPHKQRKTALFPHLLPCNNSRNLYKKSTQRD